MKPSEVRLSQLSSSLSAGREARFQCSTVGARPEARLYFLFNGIRRQSALVCKPDTQCVSIFSVQLTRQMNGALLHCVADSPRIPNSAITDQLKLDVHCE